MKISHCFIFLNLINVISSFLFNKTNENEGNIEITAYLKTLGNTNIEIIWNQFYFLDGINNSHAVVLRNEKSNSTLEHFLSDSQLFSIEYLDIKNQPLKGMKNRSSNIKFQHCSNQWHNHQDLDLDHLGWTWWCYWGSESYGQPHHSRDWQD